MQDVIISHHNRNLSANLLLPSRQARTAVVFSHGFNGSKADFLPEAELCRKAGCAALCIDFCGGSVRDRSGFPTSAMTLGTEKEDLHAAADFALRTSGAERVFLFGGSQGGLISALVAEERRDVCAMMLLYPALCIPDDWRRTFPDGKYPETYILWGMTIGRDFFADACARDVFSQIGRFSGPVRIVHGTSDRIVPIDYSRRAAARYPNARLTELAGEDHGFSPAGGIAVRRLLEDMLREENLI